MSICAQSWDSVPPAPGWMDRIAFLPSWGPESMTFISKASSAVRTPLQALLDLGGRLSSPASVRHLPEEPHLAGVACEVVERPDRRPMLGALLDEDLGLPAVVPEGRRRTSRRRWRRGGLPCRGGQRWLRRSSRRRSRSAMWRFSSPSMCLQTSSRVRSPSRQCRQAETAVRPASRPSACRASTALRRASRAASSTPRSPSGSQRVMRPLGSTKAEIPVFAARAIATRCSTALSGSMPRCCQGPLVSPEPRVVGDVGHEVGAAGHEAPEQLGEDDLVADHRPEPGASPRRKTVSVSPAPKSEMNSAQLAHEADAASRAARTRRTARGGSYHTCP